MTQRQLNLCEVYPSINHLGDTPGRPVLMVRLFGNNFEKDVTDFRDYASFNASRDHTNNFKYYPNEVAKLISDIEPKYTQKNWVLCGGEPMIQQQEVVRVVEEYVELTGKKPALYWMTNGTIAPSDSVDKVTSGYIVNLKLSSALANKASRDTFSIRIKEESVKKLVANRKASFYFNIFSENDFKEVHEICSMFKIPSERVTLLPFVTEIAQLRFLGAAVHQTCVKYGFKFSLPSDVLVHGKKRGL